MVGNEDFQLSQEQLLRYNDWLTDMADANLVAESFMGAVEVRFTFCPFGRQIFVKVSGSTEEFILEDWAGDPE